MSMFKTFLTISWILYLGLQTSDIQKRIETHIAHRHKESVDERRLSRRGPPAKPDAKGGGAPAGGAGAPFAILVTPTVREGTSFTGIATDEGCGQTQSASPLFITASTTLTTFKWLIPTAIPNAMCSFEISTSNDKSFQILMPWDESTKTFGNGVFPCAKENFQVEKKDYVLKNYACDACIVRWNLYVSNGVMRQCADVKITKDDSGKKDHKS
eukprot:TRINITY_DN1254_c0_g1_i2.p1 TRINITY_DN1254_c0_g1~~TRINITY_DN1254_c0_g1_i2.p1  ORF type:complete len:213 (+),score=31.85 TRINITY_DN1254_c0_g1_i2:136-774(+)